MANEQNLKHFTSNQSREEAVKNGKKGGIASGKSRLAKKTLKDMLDTLLEKEIKNASGEPVTTQEAMVSSLIARAIRGDVKAFEVVRDTIGQKPIDKHEVNTNEIPKIIDDLSKPHTKAPKGARNGGKVK